MNNVSAHSVVQYSGAVIVAPLRGRGTCLRSLALQRISLLLEPLFQDRVRTYLLEVVTVREVHPLLNGELRASELTMPRASATQTIKLPIARRYYGHSLTYLLIRESWNLLSRAQSIAPL